MKFYLAVKGIIRRKDEKILILKRSAGDDHLPEVWETVGGGMDAEQPPQEALKREIKEETGLEVSVHEPFNVFTFRKQTGEFKIGITFLCDTEDDTVVLSHEHSDYRWINPKEFAGFPSVPSLYEEIDRYTQSVNR